MTSVEENYCNHTLNKYKNIEYTPPVHKEAMPFHAFNLMKRAIGDNPYKGSQYRVNLIKEMYIGM